MEQEMIKKFEIFFKECKNYIIETYDQIEIEEKGSSDLVTNVDIEIEQKIITFINEHFPQDKIIAEESAVDELTHEATWLIDPIDGTINFSYGSKIYGIQITRVVDKEPAFSILYLPEMEDFYCAIKGQGAYRNGKRLSVQTTLPMRLSIVSFGDFSSSCKASRPYQMDLIDILKEEVSKIRIFGSSCMDFSAVASGQTHCHIMFSKRVWEFKGGLLLAEEAGLTSALIEIPKTDVRAVCVAHDPKVIERIKKVLF
jgi:myo-inositol-1(or 4)-monophosphatase